MEEKELELTPETEAKETQPKKKTTKKKAQPKDTGEDAVAEQTNEAPVEDAAEVVEIAKEEAVEEPVAEEKVVEEPVVEEKDAEEPVKPVEEKVVEKPVNRKQVPSPKELRAMRKFNESVFTFEDGFACVATSQRVADAKHAKWLED